MPVVLTIAGSDSGGGAGIQADLKTFEALGVFGTTALTCVTAQNPAGVTGVQALDPDIVRRQIAAVCSGFPVSAAKTGMLYSADIIRAVAESLATYPMKHLVVDPVMVATSGSRLLREDAVAVLRELLLPRAAVITPNLPEAEVLSGSALGSLDAIRKAALNLSRAFGTAVVVKGGHLEHGQDVVDVLAAEGRVFEFSIPRVKASETHGTGCTFSAALTAHLALGSNLPEAVRAAQAFVASALEHAVAHGGHSPLDWKTPGRGVPWNSEAPELLSVG